MCVRACDVRVIILERALGIRESPVLCLQLGTVCSVSFCLVGENCGRKHPLREAPCTWYLNLYRYRLHDL